MDWLAYSPDLNPIEHVWEELGRRIAARQPPPICLPQLRRALLDEWCNIPHDQIDNLILSMPRRWPIFRKESPVSATVVTHVGAPIAWGPRIIDTAVATPLLMRTTTNDEDTCNEEVVEGNPSTSNSQFLQLKTASLEYLLL
ncbi:transposable element Tc3 transposase [Trichonephila clavipes]|nr:transposable element Tc3 transposase [Trichonephila clavipes]